MTTQYVDIDIRSDEGLSLPAYVDPRSGGEPITIGFGTTQLGLTLGTVWTLAQCKAAQLAKRLQNEAALDQRIPWWRQLNDPRQDCLSNMSYNLGVHGLMEFPHALAAMQAGDFETAAAQMLNSDWAREVPKRANRLAEQMRTGVRAASPIPPAVAQPVPANDVDPLASIRNAVGSSS